MRRLARLIALLPWSLSAQATSFVNLGWLPEGGTQSGAYGISADGTVVVGSAHAAGAVPRAFRWTAAQGLVALGSSPGVDPGYALDVSGDGSVIVGYDRLGTTPHAFRWTASDGSVGLGTLPGGALESLAYGVSRDGAVVVGTSRGEAGTQPFRWTESTGMAAISIGFGTRGAADAVSADGTTVVGSASTSFPFTETHPFRWTAEGGAVSLGALPGGYLSGGAYGVSADGRVVVGTAAISGGSREAFRWTAETGMVGLGLLPGFQSTTANAVSDDGRIIVGYAWTGREATIATIWDPVNGLRSLEDALENEYGLALAGWSLAYANAITPDGRTIVGTAFDTSLKAHAFLVAIPEPSTGALVVIGVAACSIGRATRRRTAQLAPSPRASTSRPFITRG